MDNKKELNIIFFGEDSFSAVVLNSLLINGFKVVMVATPIYDNYLYKRLEQLTDKYQIPLFRVSDINEKSFVVNVKNFRPDLIVTAHFEKLLKYDLIQTPSLGCINLHPSLLPKYRGMAPQHWPIINGDRETGVTVHFIEEGIDTGDIILQKKITIAEDVYVSDLQQMMLPIYKTIVVDAINALQNSDCLFIKQEIQLGTYFKKLKVEDTIISHDFSKKEAYNLIRAVSKPYMGARFGNYKIWKAHYLIDEIETISKMINEKVGIIKNETERHFLSLKDGVLEITDFEIIDELYEEKNY